MEMPESLIKYDVIVADPPWHFSSKGAIPDGHARTQYNCMKTRDIARMDVSSIAKPSCLLFMWTTGCKMSEAIEIGLAWGFKYKTVFRVWDKMRPRLGFWVRNQYEFVLLFTRGPRTSDIVREDVRKRFSQQLRSPSLGHSRKPDSFYVDLLKYVGFDRDCIDLFARKKHPGFDAWGDQVE